MLAGKIMVMTHDELIKRAEKWLLNTMGCSFRLTELTTIAGEIPDAIGWKNGKSVLVECKATRADFLSDKKKWFRKISHVGMGTYRFYMCPPGLIRKCELPDKWGLLYCHEKTIKRVVAPKGNCFSGFPSFEPNAKNETIMLCSVIRRVHLRGDLDKIYTMDQKQRALNQAKEDLEILENLKIKAIPNSYDWHRYRRSIEAKRLEIKRLEGKCE